MRLHPSILLFSFIALVSCDSNNEIISLIDGETRLSATRLAGSDDYTIVYTNDVPSKLVKHGNAALSEKSKSQLEMELRVNGVDSLFKHPKSKYLYSYAPGYDLVDVFIVECENDSSIKYYFRQNSHGNWLGPLSTSHWIY
jgi:hypothetical protein